MKYAKYTATAAFQRDTELLKMLSLEVGGKIFINNINKIRLWIETVKDFSVKTARGWRKDYNIIFNISKLVGQG